MSKYKGADGIVYDSKDDLVLGLKCWKNDVKKIKVLIKKANNQLKKYQFSKALDMITHKKYKLSKPNKNGYAVYAIKKLTEKEAAKKYADIIKFGRISGLIQIIKDGELDFFT